MPGRISGAHGQVMIDPTGGATAVAVANLNKWDLDLGKAMIDVTAFGDTNLVYVTGLPDYKGNLAGFWDSSAITLFTVALGTVACFLKLIPSSLETTVFFSGKAWLDASVAVDAKGAVTIGGKWVAAGAWAIAP